METLMLISKASFNVNTLVVVVVHFTVTLPQKRKHWTYGQFRTLWNKLRNLFPGAAGKCFQSADFIFCRFSSKSKTILPCRFTTLLSSAVAFSSCNTHTNSLLRSCLSQQSLLFDERNWPAAAVACMYVLFSKLLNAGIGTNTHTLNDTSGSRLLLFCVTAKFTLLSRKCTTHHFGQEEYLILFVSQLQEWHW